MLIKKPGCLDAEHENFQETHFQYLSDEGQRKITQEKTTYIGKTKQRDKQETQERLAAKIFENHRMRRHRTTDNK
jgi:hypothetical protein